MGLHPFVSSFVLLTILITIFSYSNSETSNNSYSPFSRSGNIIRGIGKCTKESCMNILSDCFVLITQLKQYAIEVDEFREEINQKIVEFQEKISNIMCDFLPCKACYDLRKEMIKFLRHETEIMKKKIYQVLPFLSDIEKLSIITI